MLLAIAIPGTPAGHPALAQTADSSIVFAENSEEPVGTFRASDQDGDSIAWSLGGPDADLLSIEDGILSFRDPPDYEDPQSAAAGTNAYRVTIRASGGTHEVTVTVTDVDEAGEVSISRLQPQVSRPLSARLSDADDGVTDERWQWARSQDGTTWEDIAGATSLNRSPVPADEGMYLRAAVTYSDKFGPGKSASAVSANRVEARTLSNAAPSLAGQDRDDDGLVLRSVRENTAVGRNVGRSISATDADNDILFYELLDTPDLEDADGQARFTVDSRSGQIRVGKELGADDGQREDEDSESLPGLPELPAGEDADEEDNSKYVLRLRVSDPSTASATVNVIVRVTDVDEAPVFSDDAPTELLVGEGTDQALFWIRGGTRVDVDADTYAVTDEDEGDDPPFTYSVTGDDRDVLEFNDDDILSFKAGHETDLEEKTSYSITVVARSGRRTSSLDVTVYVRDSLERGEVSLSQREPQVGTDVYATVIDADGGPTARSWTWERSGQITEDGDGTPSAECRDNPDTPDIPVVVGWTPIEGASSSTYTPQASDAGRCLRAIAVYRDNLHRAIVAAYPIVATVDLETCLADTRETGELTCETPAVGTVQVETCTADPVTLELTCTVTTEPVVGTFDVHIWMAREVGTSEAPVQGRNPANAAPKFVDQDLNAAGDQSARTSRKVAENTEAGQGIGSPVSANDEDGDLPIYSLGGEDAEFFGISRITGQLMTKASLNYEARRSYAVIVTATDPSGASDSIHVTINVTDVHDPVTITGDRSVRYAENGTGPVASYGAFDEEGHAIEWSLSGPDSDLLAIDGGVLSFRRPPNYEHPESASTSARLSARNIYRVTIRAAGGTRGVTVTVTDVDEVGTVRIDRPQPQVDRPLTASLLDEDGGVTDERWQWARSRDGRTWRDIEGAISPARTPGPDDVGMYLRARVNYSDSFGSGKTASTVTSNQVEARTVFNDAPSFAGQDEDEDTTYIDISRSVAENTAVGMPIGEPLTASDENQDVLLYELLDTPDLEDDDMRARFTIDRLSGQLRVGRVLGADPGQTEDEVSTDLVGDPALPTDEDADDAGNSKYVLRVRVSDPSTASATVNVIVTVTEVNEAPHFDANAPTLLSVTEVTQGDASPVIRIGHGNTRVDARTYAVTDQDGRVSGDDGYDDTIYTYSVSGPDSEDLAFDEAGVLSFLEGHEPDFEDRSSYSITVEAHSGEGDRRLTSTLDVTIEVVDAEDPGGVVLSQRQPQVGIAIHALAGDEDGGVTIKRWRWERSAEVTVNNRGIPSFECEDDPGTPGIDGVGGWTAISGALAAVYTPTQADVSRCLRATAIYTDNIGNRNDEATGILEVPARVGHSDDADRQPDSGFVNVAPVFPDQDHHTEGDQSDTTIRTVAENTEAERSIGEAVSARDDDDDLLIYTLGGEDAESFSISRNTGQLLTKADLDYEARNSYTVVVTVTDPFGATDSITVTINVTDEDDPAVIRLK